MAIQTTLSFEDPKLVGYMEMYAALEEAYNKGLPTNHGDASNGYTDDLYQLFYLWECGIQTSNILYCFHHTSCFHHLEKSYRKYILKEDV
jgi:hypothetical protein